MSGGASGRARRRQNERRDAFFHRGRDRFEFCQPLDARLGLRRLAGRGAETVDEALQMRALGFLLDARRGLEPALFRALRFEIIVPARVERELTGAQMQDRVDRIIEKLAIVADDQRGMRVFLQARFEPQRALEIEIVGRLVEQEQVRLGEQSRRQRHAHAPAAGKLRHGAMQIVIGEAEPA